MSCVYTTLAVGNSENDKSNRRVITQKHFYRQLKLELSSSDICISLSLSFFLYLKNTSLFKKHLEIDFNFN